VENPFSSTPDQIPSSYYLQLTAAFVRGELGTPSATQTYFKKPLEDLIHEENHELVKLGEEKKLELDFLKKETPAPYLDKLFGVLRGVQPDQVLNLEKKQTDFIWQLVDEFHYLPTIALSMDEKQVGRIKSLHKGGFTTLSTKENLPFPKLQGYPSNQFDVVTCTDGFETEAELMEALPELTRIVKRFIILTFPEGFNQKLIRGYLESQNILQFRVEKPEEYCILIGRK
jgi:hypothetical protein